MSTLVWSTLTSVEGRVPLASEVSYEKSILFACCSTGNLYTIQLHVNGGTDEILHECLSLILHLELFFFG